MTQDKDGDYLVPSKANLETEKGVGEWQRGKGKRQLWELWGRDIVSLSQRDHKSSWAEMGSPTSLSPKAAQAAFCHGVANVTGAEASRAWALEPEGLG